VLALLGASTALEISDIPFDGPIAAVRVGRLDGSFVVNPTKSELEESDIDIIVAGNKSAVVMVEGGGTFVPEADMIEAIFHGHNAIQPMLQMQAEMKAELGKPKRHFVPPAKDETLESRVTELSTPLLQEVIRSSIEVARVVLSPSLPISPTLVALTTAEASEAGKVILGNSITLSPGTVTIDVDEDELLVHCLTRESALELTRLEAQRRVAGLEIN